MASLKDCRISGVDEREEAPPNQALHLTGAALLVSRDIKLLRRPRQVSLVVRRCQRSASMQFIASITPSSRSHMCVDVAARATLEWGGR